MRHPVPLSSLARSIQQAECERAQVSVELPDRKRDQQHFEQALNTMLDAYGRAYGNALPEEWADSVLTERRSHRVMPGTRWDPRR